VVTSSGSSAGADQENATTVFSLAIASTGVSSGLQTTDGTNIFLVKEGDLVIGRIGGTDSATNKAAFAVAIDSITGVVSVAQYASLKNNPAETNGDASEPVSIDNSALQAVVTVTDGDGDKATQSVNIGAKVQFLDDGPTAKIALTGTSVAHDESAGFQADDNAAAATPFAHVVNPSTDLPAPTPDDPFALSASAVVTSSGSSAGADQENATTVFSLSVAPGGVDSGVTTTDGTKIFLFKEGDLVVGRIGATAATAATGQAALAVAINSSSGVVSTAQYASLKHGTASNPDTSEAVSITDSALQAGGAGAHSGGRTAPSPAR